MIDAMARHVTRDQVLSEAIAINMSLIRVAGRLGPQEKFRLGREGDSQSRWIRAWAPNVGRAFETRVANAPAFGSAEGNA